MISYTVRRGDPRRVAAAVIGYQVRQPRFLAAVGGFAVVFLVIGAVGAGAGGALVGLLLVIAIQTGVVLFKRAQLARALTARGYRPGSVIETEFAPEVFTISTSMGSGVHPYPMVVDARRIRDVMLLRLGEARVVVALPMELVPDDAAARLLSGS